MIIPIVIVVLIAGFFFMKDVLKTEHTQLDWISAALSTIGFGSLLFGFSEVGDKGWTDSLVVATLIIGAIFVILFGARQLRSKNPFLDLRVLKIPEFSISATLSSVSMIAMVGAEMVLPLYIQTVRGESAFHSGLTLLPGALMMGVLSPITGRLFDRIGARRLATTGMFLLTIGTLPFAFITRTTPMLYIIVLYAIRMAGISMAMMPVTTAGMNSLPFDKMGHGTAVNNTLRQVASSMGTAILVSVLTNVTNNQMPAKHLLKAEPLAYKDQAFNATISGYHASFWIAVAFSALGLIIAFFVSNRSGSSAEVQPQAGGEK